MRVTRTATGTVARLALVAVLALTLVAVAGCAASKADTAAQHRTQCFANEKKIKMAMDLVFADSDMYPDIANVVKELGVSCPDGGTYTFDPKTNTVSCSVHGHE